MRAQVAVMIAAIGCDGGQRPRTPTSPTGPVTAIADAAVGDAAVAEVAMAPAIDAAVAAVSIDAAVEPAIPDALRTAPAWIGRAVHLSDKAPHHSFSTHTLRRSGNQALLEIERGGRENRGDEMAPWSPGKTTRHVGEIVERGNMLTFTALDGLVVRCKRTRVMAAGAAAGRKAIGGEDCSGEGRWVPAKMTRVAVLECDEGAFTLAPAPGIELLTFNDDCSLQGSDFRLIGASGAIAQPRAR